jgi:hypothetical protein
MKTLRGKDWFIRIFKSGAQCWKFPSDPSRFYAAKKEMTKSIDKEHRSGLLSYWGSEHNQRREREGFGK